MSSAKRWLWAPATLVVAAGLWVAMAPAAIEPRTSTQTRPPARPAESPRALRPSVREQGTEHHTRLQERSERLSVSVTNAATLDSLLDQLQDEAVRAGQVSAEHVQPGFAAIEKLSGTLTPEQLHERRTAFGERMRSLSARLRGAQAEHEGSGDSPGVLLDIVRKAPVGPEREAAIQRYLNEVGSLPPEQSIAAAVELNRVVAELSGQTSEEDR